MQESLTNAARHAGDVPVSLSLNVGADHLELELTNLLDASIRGDRAADAA